MATGPSQDTTRYPEGGTSRKLTGPEGLKGPTEGAGRTRGGTLPGGNKPIRSNPKTNKKNAQNNRGRHKQHPPKAKSHTQHPRTNTGKRPNQPQPTHQGQAAQADYQSRPIDTGPNTPTGDKQNKKKEYTQGTEGQPDNRGERRPKVKRNKRGVKQASRREQKGGESIYVIRRVVCSRKCCLSDLRVAVQLFSRAKETGLLSS